MVGCGSPRALDTILSTIVVVMVMVSWGFVIYSARVAVQWELEKRTNTQT